MPAQTKAYTLRQIREQLGTTQQEVAKRMRVPQPTISRIERRSGTADSDSVEIETLRRYLLALGGKLELVARFKWGEVKLL